jgi:hypothetical protein
LSQILDSVKGTQSVTECCEPCHVPCVLVSCHRSLIIGPWENAQSFPHLVINLSRPEPSATHVPVPSLLVEYQKIKGEWGFWRKKVYSCGRHQILILFFNSPNVANSLPEWWWVSALETTLLPKRLQQCFTLIPWYSSFNLIYYMCHSCVELIRRNEE